MGLTDILSLAIAAILVNNYILVQFLGCCSFFGVSKKTDTALGMGMAVIFVMAIASAASWAVQYFILEPLGLGYMQTIAFILVIATLVQFVEMFMKKAMPSLYSALGIFLPLSNYINSEDAARKIWTIEIPFIVASVLMVISAMVLFFTIKENKIAEEMKVSVSPPSRPRSTTTSPCPRPTRPCFSPFSARSFCGSWPTTPSAHISATMLFII